MDDKPFDGARRLVSDEPSVRLASDPTYNDVRVRRKPGDEGYLALLSSPNVRACVQMCIDRHLDMVNP